MIKLCILDVDGVLTDGKKYYEDNKDDYGKLMHSYDYEWIKGCFKSLYPEQTVD